MVAIEEIFSYQFSFADIEADKYIEYRRSHADPRIHAMDRLTDDVVDELFDKVKAELIDFIREHPEDGEQAEDLLMVAKYFERIGDHATNIAEWVEFALDDKVRKS